MASSRAIVKMAPLRPAMVPEKVLQRGRFDSGSEIINNKLHKIQKLQK